MNTKNTTYLLGAGASCYSQPLVFDMKERMLSLLELIDTNSRLHEVYISESLLGKTEELFIRYNSIVLDAVKHYTPDTYAKKLHLKREKEKLKLFKEFLNLYFLFEQDYIKDTYKNLPQNPYNTGLKVYAVSLYKDTKKYSPTLIDEKMSKETWDKIHRPIDYRYDVFFATLLEAFGDKELTLPSNINILSWNYDNQLELAYKEYENTDFERIDRLLNINPTEYNTEKSHIIKINGSCQKVYKDENNITHELTFLKALELLIEKKNLHNKINFAWEHDIYTLKWDIINKIQSKTTTLVIIGYSFPNFNKDIDITLLHYINKTNCDIIIQVPDKEEFMRIRERVLLRNPLLKPEKIIHKVDDGQFYIPI